MISFPWRRLFRETWHPSYEELVLYLDGELGAKAGAVEAHLKSCWSCRLRREKVDRVISTFMETRSASFGDSPKFPVRGLASFDAKLERLEDESGSRALFSGLVRAQAHQLWSLVSSWRFAAFAVSLAVMLLIFIRSGSVPSVSAEEVLGLVSEAEKQRVRQVFAPVIYEKFHLRRDSAVRRPEIMTLEIWNDTANRRLRQRVADSEGLRFLPVRSSRPTSQSEEETLVGSSLSSTGQDSQTRFPAILAELGELFSAHQADLSRPLSSANYEAWRRALRSQSEEVVEEMLPGGDRAMILKTSGKGPFLPNALVSAKLTVRADDWHPIEQQLEVQKAEGIVHFTMGEVASKVITLSMLPPSIFLDLELASEPPALPPPAPPVLLAPIPVVPSSSDLLAAEVEAWHALHTVGACLGRPITVTRTGTSQIEVQGVVETDESKAQVLEALRGIPHVVSKIQTVEEDWVKTSTETLPTPVPDSDPPGSAEPPARRLATEDLLRSYIAFGRCGDARDEDQNRCVERHIAQLSQKTLISSEAVLSQAWALRQLAQWNPLLKQRDWRTSTRRLLEVMVRNHLDALKSAFDESRLLVEPVLSSLLSQESRASDPAAPLTMTQEDEHADWASGSLRLCFEVEAIVNLTLGMFVETNQPETQREPAMRSLLLSFADLDSKFRRLEWKVASELADVPRTATKVRRE